MRRVAIFRARGLDGTILGCTEIPLLLGAESDAVDTVNPAGLLAEAAVRFAIGAE
jgi:aspartate/glutamate racemase